MLSRRSPSVVFNDGGSADAVQVLEGQLVVQDEAAFEALLEREGAKLGVARHAERFVGVQP